MAGTASSLDKGFDAGALGVLANRNSGPVISADAGTSISTPIGTAGAGSDWS